MIMKMNIFTTITVIASYTTLSHAYMEKHHRNVYDNIENCPNGFSGAECDIKYETCLDNKRKCFNNSQCKLMPSSSDDGYLYECDCSYSASISLSAGQECEHQATVTCKKNGDNHFCTNGGKCGTYSSPTHNYRGCHCLSDFVGEHCQYLKESMVGGLEGENTFISGAGMNFHAKEMEKRSNHDSIVIIAIALASTVVLMVVWAFKKQQKGQLDNFNKKINIEIKKKKETKAQNTGGGIVEKGEIA